MLAERAATSAGLARSYALPIDLETALEFIVDRFSSFPAPIKARIIGRPELVGELLQYAPALDSSRQLIALGTEQELVWGVLREIRPECVCTLVSGPLAGLLQPVRSEVVQIASDLPGRAWKSAGYKRVDSQGFLGPGAISWAAGERFAGTLSRPDLADRSRIAMRQCASASRSGRLLSTVLVREYRSVK